MADPNNHIHHQEINEATEYLLQQHLSKFLQKTLVWEILQFKGNLHNFPLSKLIHSGGICLRHIGYLFKSVKENNKFQCVKTLLVLEALARVIKNKLRALLRRKMKLLKEPLEAPYRKLIVQYLNLVFGTSDLSNNHWNGVLKKQLKSKFHFFNISITDPFFQLQSILYTWLVFFLFINMKIIFFFINLNIYYYSYYLFIYY